MTDQPPQPPNRHRALNPRFGGAWAKTEIFLGLLAQGAGVFWGVGLLIRPFEEVEWSLVILALALYVLGGYLALAGHRSHLYRSHNELAVHLTEEIHRLQDKG